MAEFDLFLEHVRPNVPSPPGGNTETRFRVKLADGRELGTWRDPEHSAARFLIDNGLAERGDVARFSLGGVACSRAGVGWLADTRVEETDRVGPRVVKWKPFLGRGASALLPSGAEDGVSGLLSTGVGE
jgi:hypothetical protein